MTSLADPLGSSPIVQAVLWTQQTLLGTIATTVAVIAVASVGLTMLTGRISVRRGAAVVLGCFLLFGASSIAAGIRLAATGSGFVSGDDPQASVVSSPPIEIPPARPPAPDPYAGASVPPR